MKNILHDTNKRVFDEPKIIWLIFTFLTKLLLNRKAQQGGITIDHSELFPLTRVFLDPLLIIHVQILKRADTHVTQFGILTRFEQGWQSKNFWLFLTREQGKTIEAFVSLPIFSEPLYWVTIWYIGLSYFGRQWNTIKTITRRVKEMTSGLYSLYNSNSDFLQFGLSAKSTLFLLLQNNTASIFERVVQDFDSKGGVKH